MTYHERAGVWQPSNSRTSHARLDPATDPRHDREVKRGDHQAPGYPAGHVQQAVAAIGAMSLVLVLGLELAGALDRMNHFAAGLISTGGLAAFPLRLPGWLPWLATVLAAFGMAAAVLQTTGTARRIMLWLTTAVLVAAWAPVLALAAHHPSVAGPWVATIWSGACALFYASRHRMPCDESQSENP